MFFKEVIENEKNPKVIDVLINQKKKYDYLKTQSFFNGLFQFIQHDKVLLPPDALLHGTNFSTSVLNSIKQHGILASEFSFLKVDSYYETFYMADFFKNVTGKNLSFSELINCYDKSKVINYLPSNEQTTTPKVAFVVNSQNKAIKDYLKLDLFSDNNASLFNFIDEEMFFSIERRKKLHQYDYKLGQSSVPIGVPYSALCGIVIDKTLEKNENNELDFIKNLFGKELFVISTDGKVLSAPQLIMQEEMKL